MPLSSFFFPVSIVFLLFPYTASATSSFHHHVSLCLHGPFDNPHVACAVYIIIHVFFTCCQCSFTSRYFHSASATGSTLSLPMLWCSSRFFLIELPCTYSWLKLLMPSFCCNKPHVHGKQFMLWYTFFICNDITNLCFVLLLHNNIVGHHIKHNEITVYTCALCILVYTGDQQGPGFHPYISLRPHIWWKTIHY